MEFESQPKPFFVNTTERRVVGDDGVPVTYSQPPFFLFRLGLQISSGIGMKGWVRIPSFSLINFSAYAFACAPLSHTQMIIHIQMRRTVKILCR